MQCGGLYECTILDIVVNGAAIFGLIVWLVSWFMHTVGILYARSVLFKDSKQEYFTKRSRSAHSTGSKSSTDRPGRDARSSSKRSWFSRKLEQRTKPHDKDRLLKVPSDSVEDNLDTILVGDSASKSTDEAKLEVSYENSEQDYRKGGQTSADVKREGDEASEVPGVSILKPVCGVDARLEENLESFFLLDYPKFELLFCMHTDTDPATPLIHKLMAKYPQVDSRLLIGAKMVGVNPKINNMQQGYDQAKYELVLVSDSGLVTQPDTLTQMVYSMLDDDRNGIVHQLPFINLEVYAPPREAESLPPPVEVKSHRHREEREWLATAKPAADWPLISSSVTNETDAVLASKSVSFGPLDGEVHKSKSVCGDERLKAAGSLAGAPATRKTKATHKHSASVDINSSYRYSASRFAFPQRSHEAYDDARERSAQSDWTEVDLQLGETISNASQLKLATAAPSRLHGEFNKLNVHHLSSVGPRPTFSVLPSRHDSVTTIAPSQPSVNVTKVQETVDSQLSTAISAKSTVVEMERTDASPASVSVPAKLSAESLAASRFSAFVSALQVVYFGGQHARMYLTAQALGINCVNGMSTLIRKKALDSIGGLSAFAQYLAEDYFIALRLVAAGYRTPMCSRVALQNASVSGTSVSQFEGRIQRWYALRISMLPQTMFLEPLSECIPVGVLASWSLAHLADYYLLHPLAIFLLHLFVWFFLDYVLICIIARSAHLRSAHSARSVERSTDDSCAEVASSGEKASFAYASAVLNNRRLLLYSKTDLLAAWLYRECTSLLLQLRALPRRHIVWRNKVYRVRWGGHTVQV